MDYSLQRTFKTKLEQLCKFFANKFILPSLNTDNKLTLATYSLSVTYFISFILSRSNFLKISWLIRYMKKITQFWLVKINAVLGNSVQKRVDSVQRSNKQVTNQNNPLFSLSQVTLVDWKIFVLEWLFCISNGVITLVDRRPKNRLQLIFIVHKKYLES